MRKGIAWSLVAATLLSLPLSGLAGTRETTVLIVPARTKVIQFAFDMAGVRPITLVSYQPIPESTGIAVHVWDANVREWVRTSFDEFDSGNLFEGAEKASTVVVAPSAQEIPAALAASAEKFSSVTVVPDLNVVPMLNGLDKVLRFTPSEWRWLAGRYDLRLQDTNADRRRWGRYGPPKGTKPSASRSMNQESSDTAAPAAAAPSLSGSSLPPSRLPEPEDMPAVMDAPEGASADVLQPADK